MDAKRKKQLLSSPMQVKELAWSYLCENEHWMTCHDPIDACLVHNCDGELTNVRKPRKKKG